MVDLVDTAVILAGGLGTRLRPLTDETPKPLLPLKGKPIVQHIIENLKKYGITNIILSIGYRAQTIQKYFGDGSQMGVSITYCVENEPLGTGGAIKEASKDLTKPFIALNGDNLADFNYEELVSTHLRNSSKVTMTLYPVEDVTLYGIADLEGENIKGFIEKPTREEAPSNLNNAGAYVIDPTVLSMLPEGKSSIERDCFEKLAPTGVVFAYNHKKQWFPTDTLEKYKNACLEFLPDINLKEKKVVIADVDETICETCSEIKPDMAHHINSLINQGFTFAFISGTTIKELQRMVSSGVKEEHHLLGTTGTNYTKIKSDILQEVYNYSLTCEEKKDIFAAFEKLIEHYKMESMTTKEDQLQDRESQVTLSPLGRHAPIEIKKNYDPEGEKRKEFVQFLKPFIDENRFDMKIGGTTSLDVTKKGLDKAWGIKRFAEHHGIELRNILFIGDKIYPGGNDYAASKIVDCVAVRNHEDALKKLQELFPINLNRTFDSSQT